MQNVTCQDQNAEIFEVHVQNSALLPEVVGKFFTYAEALAWEALAVADRLDAVPDTGADPGAEAERSEGTATGAALLSTPHGNHGDNQQ